MIRDHRITKTQIESILHFESLKNNTDHSWHNSEYQYGIENSNQGKTTLPYLIGDKKAGGSTRVLLNDMWILDYLQDLYKDGLKIVFVERASVDIVAAYSYYMKQEVSQFHVDRYLENLEVVNQVKAKVSHDSFLNIKQEQFINHASETAQQIFDYLGLTTESGDCEAWTQSVRSDIKGKSKSIHIPEHLSKQL